MNKIKRKKNLISAFELHLNGKLSNEEKLRRLELVLNKVIEMSEHFTGYDIEITFESIWRSNDEGNTETD